MNELDEMWKAKSLNESQSIQSIKVKALISSEDGKLLYTSTSAAGDNKIFQSMINEGGSSLFGSRNENKLITNITMNAEQKKKYEELSKKFIDMKQKLVN